MILIGIVALIFLGPRKLPQIAKTIAKTMAEFRSATNEFKQTWEREVNFEEEMKAFHPDNMEPGPIARVDSPGDDVPGITAAPEIREIDKESFDKTLAQPTEEDPGEVGKAAVQDAASDKRNWL